jgi:hypothetical protein
LQLGTLRRCWRDGVRALTVSGAVRKAGVRIASKRNSNNGQTWKLGKPNVCENRRSRKGRKLFALLN